MLWFGTVPCWQCPVPFRGYFYASRYALCPFEALYIVYVRDCTKVDVPEGGLEGDIADVRVNIMPSEPGIVQGCELVPMRLCVSSNKLFLTHGCDCFRFEDMFGYPHSST